MSFDERALMFDCAGATSVGIISSPHGVASPDTGVLFVVGGPQYRVGSHRIFVQIARRIASSGLPAMRFDYRGMGDSWADSRDFKAVDDDIRSAVDSFFAEVPSLKRVVLWGLCDGASASCMYAPQDKRVHGLILLNPWVHTPAGAATTRLKHYYLKRLISKAFWQKLISGRVSFGESLKGLLGTLKQSLAQRRSASTGSPQNSHAPLPQRMALQLKASKAPVAIALSELDQIAQEFADQAMPTPEWRSALDEQCIEVARLRGADHTLTSAEGLNQVLDLTVKWAKQMALGRTH